MALSTIVQMMLAASAVKAQMPTGILGFNSGATTDSYKAKQQSERTGRQHVGFLGISSLVMPEAEHL